MIRRPRRAVPYVAQQHSTDCGAACVAMVLRFHGSDSSLDRVRAHLDSGRDGVSALRILEAAPGLGLRGRAVRARSRDLSGLGRGAILHWCMNHFVVLDRVSRRGVTIVDPAAGRRRLPRAEVARCFTGVAILLEPSGPLPSGPGAGSRWRPHVRRLLRETGVLLRILGTSSFVQLLALALPILTGVIVDRIVPRGDVDLLLVVGLGIIGVAAFTLSTLFLRAHLLLMLRTELDRRMSLDFLEHLLRLPFPYFQRRRTGDLLVSLGSNAAIREALTSAALTALLDGLLVVAHLAALLVIHLPFGLAVLAIGVVRVGVFVASRHRYRELTTEGLHAQAESTSFQVQMLESIEWIKAAGAEQFALENWWHRFTVATNVAVRRGRLAALVDSVLASLSSGSPLALLAYGAVLVMNGTLSLGTMLAANALAAGFLAPFASLISTALALQEARGHVERVEDVLGAEPERAAAGGRTHRRLRGALGLESVSFRYAGDGPWVLRDVDLEVDAGRRVGIVGPTGCGKSTLARLIVGLHGPTSGRVVLDGQDLAGLDLGAVRRQIGYVPQSPFLFADTVRGNLAWGTSGIPLERIREAARVADLDRDVDRMPLGYDTPLATGGGALSGGQRQRIAIARAILRAPALLVLDEATSHLDSVTEGRILDNLRALGATCVMIAHRLGTVRDCDEILVMDRGGVVERGEHVALLRGGGLYSRFLEAQAGTAGALA